MNTSDESYAFGLYTHTVEDVARICHQLNKAYCESIGDNSQADWENAPEWQRESAIKGVQFHVENPFADASASHKSWLKEKEENGWKYGEEKDPDKKEHPCMVPFEELPRWQQLKDYLFKSVVDAFRQVYEGNTAGYDVPPVPPLKTNESALEIHQKNVKANKQLRKDGDAIIQKIKCLPGSEERATAMQKFQEGVMWLGMDLKRLNEPNPYPNSKDPSNDKIEPTADGLTL